MPSYPKTVPRALHLHTRYTVSKWRHKDGGRFDVSLCVGGARPHPPGRACLSWASRPGLLLGPGHPLGPLSTKKRLQVVSWDENIPSCWSAQLLPTQASQNNAFARERTTTAGSVGGHLIADSGQGGRPRRIPLRAPGPAECSLMCRHLSGAVWAAVSTPGMLPHLTLQHVLPTLSSRALEVWSGNKVSIRSEFALSPRCHCTKVCESTTPAWEITGKGRVYTAGSGTFPGALRLCPAGRAALLS